MGNGEISATQNATQNPQTSATQMSATQSRIHPSRVAHSQEIGHPRIPCGRDMWLIAGCTISDTICSLDFKAGRQMQPRAHRWGWGLGGFNLVVVGIFFGFVVCDRSLSVL